MSHSIYNTEGIVLNSFGIGESNKFFRIFTRELGLIEATAQGVRKITSKNRYGLQDFSVSDFSLVRGRDVWRIINVAPKENLYFSFIKEKREFNTLSNVFFLIKRYIHGEEKNEELFDIIFEAINFLKNNNLENRDLKNFNSIFSMKILNNLGYLGEIKQKEVFFKFIKNKIDKKLILEMEKVKILSDKIITEAMEDSHL